ncbi:nose resistant to fluoxetine protein 6-like [Phlebotomus argentipes]|uniref:nose resistant to fluoxetine protein 6-like n=1 Tax=Phlebotomus argentipes TaxID=94469 RepID=UPI00289348C2|nr:nose resistant to fluoxetine protein 6-like [Phlebotomus argentipes]
MARELFWLCAFVSILCCFAEGIGDARRLPILVGVLNSGMSSSVGSQCREDVQVAVKSIVQRDIWSLKMLDSSGDFEPNFMFQNVFWLGSRDFCHGINAPLPVYLEQRTREAERIINDVPPFGLEYRLLYGDIRSPHQIHYEKIITTVLHLGLCVPKTCSDEDVLRMSQMYFDEHRVNPIFEMTVNFTHARNVQFGWNVYTDWIFMLTLGIIIAIVLAHVVSSKVSPASLLRHFNMRENFRSLMSSTVDPKIVYSLNFYRTICSLWVTMAHVYLFGYVMVESVPLNGWRSKLFYIKLFYRSALILDVFFLMSGFVLAYNFLKNDQLSQTIKQNSLGKNVRLLLKHILHRYTRFLPTVLATLVLSRASFVLFDSIYYRDMRHNLSMESSWWIWNVLFIQNFVPFSKMAIVWTWSMASDMQCFILFQMLLFIYVKHPRLAKYLFCAAFSLSLTYSYMTLFDMIHSEHFDFTYPSFIYLVDRFYMKAHFRIYTYGCGVYIGHLCHRAIGQTVKISERVRRTLWFLLATAIALILFYSEDYAPSFALPFLFTFGRVAYTLLLGVPIAFGQWGFCNWINAIGKTPFFMRMSKLSFGQYMFHPILIHIFLASHNDVTYASFTLLISFAVTVAIITYYFATAFNVFVEAPLNRLFDDIIRIKEKRSKDDE